MQKYDLRCRVNKQPMIYSLHSSSDEVPSANLFKNTLTTDKCSIDYCFTCFQIGATSWERDLKISLEALSPLCVTCYFNKDTSMNHNGVSIPPTANPATGRIILTVPPVLEEFPCQITLTFATFTTATRLPFVALCVNRGVVWESFSHKTFC